MDWESVKQTRDGVSFFKNEKMRSLSTSTPFLSTQSSAKLFRSHSVSVYSADDSGLGDSIANVSSAEISISPDFIDTSNAGKVPSTEFRDTIFTPSVCHTPKANLFDMTLHGRHLEFSNISPVLRHKNFQTEKSTDSDFSFDNDNTISEESMSYLSKLNLDNGTETTSSSANLPHIHVPKLNFNLLDDSPADTCTHVRTQPDSGLSPEFTALLQQFMPEQRDRLIGRNIGEDHIDFVKELHVRGMGRILAMIMAYLDPQDLCSMCQVDKSWKRIVGCDRQASRRKKDYLKKRRKSEFHGKENFRKKSPSPPSRNVTGSGVLQALGNLQLLQNPSSATAPERHKTRLDLFVEASKELKNDERLQKCPKCCKPAKVLPVQERGICLQADCAFDYCINCYNEFHKARPCVPVALKRTKTDTVGTKKSKKNLKRL